MSIESNLKQLDHLEDVSFDTSASIADGRKAKDVFCAGWPSGRVVIESLAAMIKNPIVKMILNTLIKAGDAYAAKNCN